YQNGAMTDLGTLGGTSSSAFAINDAGQIVGHADLTGNTGSHAFLKSGGPLIDLGTLGGTNSVANGINSSGQIVGLSNLPGNSSDHAFLYTNGVMSDLNSLLDPGSQLW